MTATTSARTRPVYLTRSGANFRLTFPYRRDLVNAAKQLPYAQYEPDSRTWTTLVCTQSVHALRKMFYDGLTDIAVDDLLDPSEPLTPCAPATLRSGTTRRPFTVTVGLRGDGTYEKLAAIPGSVWDKKSQTLTFPPQASVPLAELAERGILDDPEHLLSPAETVIAFDTTTGTFRVRGPDDRARVAFNKHFPARDVFHQWQQRGLDVAFSDPFTAEVYRGEIVRNGPLPEVPELTVEMFEYQKRNVALALQRTGFAILDEPGLGKTIQAIAVGQQLLADGAVSRVCVLVPGAIRSQWAEEIVRFTATDPADVVVVTGDPEQRARAYENARHASWFVVHYDILAKDLKALRPLFAGALVVADEAHRLKTYTAARTKAALKLSASAARRLALSGTPLETSVTEWYQVLSGFAVPGALGDPRDFNARYRYRNKLGFYEGARNLVELRDRSQAHYARHTKREVAKHLPPLRVDQLVIDPSPQYAAALRLAHREAEEEISKLRAANSGVTEPKIAGGLFGGKNPDEDPGRDGDQMTAVGQLRMLCASPRLVLASTSQSSEALTAAGLVPDQDGPKLDELRVMAADFRSIHDARTRTADGPAEPQDVQAERFVVFTFFSAMANLIAERFEEDGIPYVLYTGDVPQKERDAAVKQFTDPNSDVLAFIATDAAAEGLNLGRCCSTLIQFDPPWTPSRAQQRMNRIHRIDGTSDRYQVINLVLVNTVERGIYRLLEQRADLQDTVLGETGTRYKTTGRRRASQSVFEEAMSQFTTAAKPAGARPPRRPPARKSEDRDGPADTLF